MGVGAATARYIRVLALVLLALMAWPTLAQAQTEADWQRGLLIATAGAPADLRAPSIELARVKAERVAKKRCRKLLRDAAAKLPVAAGKKDQGRLAKSLIDAGRNNAELGLILLDADHGSDGSVVVRMALPIDALRARLYGPDAPWLREQAASPTILVDARALRLEPSVGLQISANGADYRGPVLFFKDENAARADARVGKDATLIEAKNLKNGTLHLKAVKPELLGQRPLVVILYKEGR